MINTRTCAHLLLVVVLAFVSSGYLFAQATATGTIQGTVTDKSGAVVTGAEVIATFKATGVTRTMMTNETGNYRFDFVPAGSYQVKVSKQGFASVIQVTEVLVGQSATINVNLNPGAAMRLWR